MKNTLIYDKRQADFHRYVNDNFETLKKLREEDQKEAFNNLLLKVLSETKRYIARGIRTALAKGIISHNKYKAEDLFDQLILDVYDNLDKVEDKKDFHAWLFRKAEKLLSDMEVEEEFESYFYDNIDDYTRAEMQGMKEEFSTDGGGDLILLEELDDISYKNHNYLLKNIFLDDAHEDLMALFEKGKDMQRTQVHLDKVLLSLPPNMRSVFELATEQLFSPEDIAHIKGLSVPDIERMLDKARELLRDSLKDKLIEP